MHHDHVSLENAGVVIKHKGYFYEEIKHHIFLFASVLSFSLVLQIRNRLHKTESARQIAELASLKAQINPHFLFNTLNSIYSLAVKSDNKTAEAIISLSELMRYIIKDAKGDIILVEKEVEYIRNYIELQKSRLGNTAIINFSSTNKDRHLKIAPLILISFIENAFKYGINPDIVSTIEIDLSINDGHLIMNVINNKVAMGNEIASSGIGISNTRERLELLYPGKYNLSIKEDNKVYQVHLSINLI